MEINVRTDMAAEAHRLWQESANAVSEFSGVRARESLLRGFPVTHVEILDEQGERALGKPAGQYFTLELPHFFSRGEEDFSAAADALSVLIRLCLGPTPVSSVLIAALGNPEITPDALGHSTAASLLITRHLKARGEEGFERFCSTALCRPGVLGNSGIESAEQLRLLCERLKPERVIAVDALAGCEPERLCRTVQICDSGIAPGSGVGNDRGALSRESLGVPVVAVGVPTVIDAALFSQDEAMRGLFVSPRSIDEVIRCAGRLIGYAINLAVHPGLAVEDVDALMG